MRNTITAAFLFSFIATLLCVSTLSFAHDNDSEVGICDRLPGSWFGSYTLKSKSDCDNANGCTQGLNIMVKKSSAYIFRVTAIHTKGKTAEFDITCQDNKISIPQTLNATLNVTCETQFCTAKYDDAKVFATVMSVKEDSQ